MAPTPVFLPGKSHGQRSLMGYNLCGHKESDTPEQLTYTTRTITAEPYCSFKRSLLIFNFESACISIKYDHCRKFVKIPFYINTEGLG